MYTWRETFLLQINYFKFCPHHIEISKTDDLKWAKILHSHYIYIYIDNIIRQEQGQWQVWIVAFFTPNHVTTPTESLHHPRSTPIILYLRIKSLQILQSDQHYFFFLFQIVAEWQLVFTSFHWIKASLLAKWKRLSIRQNICNSACEWWCIKLNLVYGIMLTEWHQLYS